MAWPFDSWSARPVCDLTRNSFALHRVLRYQRRKAVTVLFKGPRSTDILQSGTGMQHQVWRCGHWPGTAYVAHVGCSA